MAFAPRSQIPGLAPEAERALGEIQSAIASELAQVEKRASSPRRRVTELVEEGAVIAKPGQVVRVQPGDEDITVYLPETAAGNAGEDIVVSFEGDGTAAGKVNVVSMSASCALPATTVLNSPGQYRYTSIGETSPKPGAGSPTPSTSAGGSWSGPPPLTAEDLPESTGLSLVGRSPSTTGNVGDITATGQRQVPNTGTAGTSVAWGVLGTIMPGGPIYDVATFGAIGDGVTDDTAAINLAIAAANVTSGAIHLMRKHKVTAALTPLARDSVHLVGRGCRADGTIIQIPTGLSPFNVITIDTVKDCSIRDMFIEGPGDWASRGLGIFIDDAFRTVVERVEIQKTHGAIEIYASVITEIIDTYAAAIYGTYGFYAYGSVADGENHALRFRGCATGTDVTSGVITWYKQGSGSQTFELINCGALHGGKGLHVCDDTPYTGSSPRFTRAVNFQCEDAEIHAVHLEAGATASFTHTLLLSCLGNAFQVDSTYSGNWEFNGGMIHGADAHGASITGDHWSITGLQVGNIDPGFDCINVGAGSTDFSITGCSLGDIFGTNSGAAYGINLDATCDRFTISGCRIIGNDTGVINNPAGAATSRVIQGCNPTSVNTVRIDEIETMAVGTVVGRRVDAGSTGRPVALTGAEQAENWRRATIQTVSGVSGVLDILLNDDTTVLLIRTTADATLRTLGDGLSSAGREIIIEHDRLSGTGNLTIAHNTAGTYSTFFNPNVSNIVLGQTTCAHVRLRSGFWRPQGGAAGISAIADDTFLANISGAVAPATAVALTTLAGAGLTGGADAILAVGAGTGITVNANDVAVTIPLTDGDKGDITVSSSGTVFTVDNDVVSDAKLRNSGALSVVGRSANSSGDPADISASAASDAVLRESGSVLGFGTIATGGIANDAVTDAKLRNSAALSVIGRSANSSGDPADISASAASGAVLRESGSVLGFGTVATAGIADAAVTLAKLANLAVGTVIGRAIDAGSTGVPTALTGAQQAQQLRYTSIVTDTTSSGAQATYTIAETTTMVRANTTSDVEVRGMTIPTAQGQRVVFHREPNSTGVWQFTHNSGGGTTQQQLFLMEERNVTLGEGSSIVFEYSNNRWRQVGGSTIRHSTALSVLGRSANSSGDPADISASAASDAVLRESGSTIGFGTIATGGIANDAVTDGKLRNSGALSVIGRSANSSGDPADISGTASSDAVLRISGTSLGFGTVATAGITDAAVTLAKMADLAQSRIIGRAESAGTGVPTALTPTQVVSIIDGESVFWTAAHEWSSSATFRGRICFSSTATAAIASRQDNFAAGALGICRFTSTGSQSLSGIVPDTTTDAQLMLVVNADDTDNLTLLHNNANSTSANRFFLPGNTDRVLLPRASALLHYDVTDGRWHMVYGV